MHPPQRAQVVPRAAATIALLRDGGDGLEVLLTHRPSSMTFAPDVHVFPGGAVDPTDHDRRLAARSVLTPEAAADAIGGDLSPQDALATFVAAIRETFEETGILLADGMDGRDLETIRSSLLREPGSFPLIVDALDLRLRTDQVVPLSRWVTPAGLPRRFDARFFAAALPDGARAQLLGDEVVAHAWHTPRAALEEMVAGRLAMWLPTSTTLQQLEHAGSIEAVSAALACGHLGSVVVEEVAPTVVRLEMPAGGGVAGQPVNAYLVGSSSVVLVDPGDPTGPALDRALQIAADRGAGIVAIALTHAAPDHAAGAQAVADALDIPVLAGPGGGRDLPYPVTELTDGASLDAGDVLLRMISTPGPAADHVAFVVGDGTFVLAGDLAGPRGARSLSSPPDEAARRRSVARLRSEAPGARWLPGHPSP